MPAAPLIVLLPVLAFSPPLAVTPPPGPAEGPQLGPRPPRDRPVRLIVAGTSTLSLGLTALVLMGIELRKGAARLTEHDDLISASVAMRRPLTAAEHRRRGWLDDEGRDANAIAIGFGVAGAVATLVGAALLGRGLVLHRRARLAWSPAPRGVGLALRF